MTYTRREMLDLLLDFVGENDDSNARNTAERLLNVAIWNIWAKMAWRQFIMPAPFLISTVARQAAYPLPAYFGRVRGGLVRNVSTGAHLASSDIEALQDANPRLGLTGDNVGAPQLYAIGGAVGVDVQPLPAGELLTADSLDAADVTTTVSISGLSPTGAYQHERLTLAGLAPVSFVGTYAWVVEFSKSLPAGASPAVELASSVGVVRLRSASGVTLVSLPVMESAIERTLITLQPTPDAAYSVSIPVLRMAPKLVFDADMIPANWGPALLEEMNALWQVNTGAIKSTTQLSRPSLTDLICLENSNRFGAASRTQPFTG